MIVKCIDAPKHAKNVVAKNATTPILCIPNCVFRILRRELKHFPRWLGFLPLTSYKHKRVKKMYTKREFSIARWGRGRKSAQSGQLKLDQFVQRTFTTTSIQGFHGFDFLSAQSTKELLMSSVDFLHNYRLSPWQQQHHVTTLLPQRPGTATYRNGTSSRNGTLRRWPHIVLRLITAFSQM